MRTIRVWFSKSGDACYISHLDLQRVMHRSLAKAQIPAWYSQGFNPHIYLTFALPLPVGQESICEAMDFRCEDDNYALDTIKEQLNRALPLGLRVLKVTEAKDKAGDIAAACYTMELPDTAAVRKAISIYNDSDSAFVAKIGKQNGRKTEKQMDLKPHLKTLEYKVKEDKLHFELTLPAGSSVNLNPALLVQFLQTAGTVDMSSAIIVRTAVLKTDGTAFV